MVLILSQFVILRGPSGGGKTTLLNILGTLDKPTTGSVTLLGRLLTSHSTDAGLFIYYQSSLHNKLELSQLRLEKIGFVFQTFNLLATMSAYENIELPMTILGKLSAKQRKVISFLIALVTNCLYFLVETNFRAS